MVGIQAQVRLAGVRAGQAQHLDLQVAAAVSPAAGHQQPAGYAPAHEPALRVHLVFGGIECQQLQRWQQQHDGALALGVVHMDQTERHAREEAPVRAR